MKKNLFKGLAIAAVSALLITTVGAVRLYAEDGAAGKIDTEEIKEQLSGVIVSTDGTDKEETVYVLTDASGSVNKVIVSNHLYNTDGSSTITDASDLSDIINTKGYEEYTEDGDNILWNADGNDIYYQGTSDKETPVTITIRYFLDGTEMSASEMAGVSGHVTIRFEYENNLAVTTDTNETYYVPFAAITGTFLDTDTFTNVSVTNGRAVNDGDRIYCVGFAFPGLSDDLGTGEGTIDIPDYVEINADTTDFEMLTTLSLVTNEPFNMLDLSGIDTDTPDGIEDVIAELKSAAAELTNGAAALYSGLTELVDGMETLKSGAEELNSGAAALSDGTQTLLEGAEQLNTGAASLASGASTLKTGAANLAAGAANAASGASQVAAGADSLEAGAVQVAAGADNLESGLSTLSQNSASLNAGGKQIFETLLDSASSQLEAAGLPVGTLTIENYAETLNNTAAYLTAYGMTAEAAQVNAVKAQLDSVNSFYVGLTAYTAGVDQAAAGAATLSAGADSLSAGAENLAAGAESLAAGIDTLNTGAATLSAGAASLSAGADTLAAGTESLAAGADTLNTGAAALSDGTEALLDGINQLLDGAVQLEAGAGTLSDALNGISDEAYEVIDELSDNLASVFERLKETLSVSKSYTSYSGIADGMNGNVKFIYRTGSIEK